MLYQLISVVSGSGIKQSDNPVTVVLHNIPCIALKDVKPLKFGC